MLAVAFGTCAMVISLSVFNGLGDFIRDIHGNFDAELQVKPSIGKTFLLDSLTLKKINQVKGVEVVTEVLEDNAFLVYNGSNGENKQRIVTVKGVSDNYLEQNSIDTTNLLYGSLELKEGSYYRALVGVNIYVDLKMTNKSYIKLFYPDRFAKKSDRAHSIALQPDGVFSVEKQYDERYVFVHMDMAQKLFGYTNERTALELNLDDAANLDAIQKELSTVLGKNFSIKSRDQQHELILKALKIEKLVAFFFLAIILFVASINIFFSLYMLQIEKRRDVAVLISMGATRKFITRIFIFEGAIISFTGTFVGIFTGLILLFIQQTIGIVPINLEASLMEFYPVRMEFLDFLLTGLVVALITLAISYYPAKKAAKVDIKTQL